eukprot:s85_g42.t1
MAGVALMALGWIMVARLGPVGRGGLCGRRGTWEHRPPVCRLAAMALGDIDLSVAGVALMALGWLWRGAWEHRPPFCDAGAALGDIDLDFVWHVQHLWHLAGFNSQNSPLGFVPKKWRTWVRWPRLFVWQAGRLVALGAGAVCVACVALGDMDLRFVWQAWRWRHRPSLCVAGVALMALGWRRAWLLWAITLCGRGDAWSFTLCGRGDAWSFTLCGRRVTYNSGLVTRLVALGAGAVCVAGVALGDTELHSLWQAWHLAKSTFTLCGKRGAYYCTGLALMTRLVIWAPGLFAWQAWRLVTRAAFCVSGVALGDMDLHFVWQEWRLVTLGMALGHIDSLCVAGGAGSGGGLGRPWLAKAAGAETSRQMRDGKVHAVVARSTFGSNKFSKLSVSERFWKLRCRKSARRYGAKHIWK